MKTEQVRKAKAGDYFSDGKKIFQLGECTNGNPHDLWFWQCSKKTLQKITVHGGIVRRVYLGSKHHEASNLDFLATLSPYQIYDRKK